MSKKKEKNRRIILSAAIGLVLSGCAAKSTVKVESAAAYLPVTRVDIVIEDELDTDITDTFGTEPDKPGIDYDEIKPNEIGEIMIIMYHGLENGSNKPRYACTAEEFKKNLEDMYEMGFRLISLSDLVNNNVTVEAGYTPVVLTFDDGLSTAFSLQETDGDLASKEGCAVDIINKFAEDHPDFGKAAVFFINGTNPFRGDGTIEERLRYLYANGYEIGNHTYGHASLGKLGADGIQEQIGRMDQFIRANLPEYESNFVAYPYGVRPRTELRELVLTGEYDGTPYRYRWAIREGQSGASAAPNNVNFDPLNVPRVRGTDNDATDLGWQLRRYIENPELRYISDGDPGRISVPAELADKVNMDSTADKELYLYGES